MAAEHPDKVANMQKHIEELAKQSAKPLFLVEQFRAAMDRLQGEPALPDQPEPALHNEGSYYEQEVPKAAQAGEMN